MGRHLASKFNGRTFTVTALVVATLISLIVLESSLCVRWVKADPALKPTRVASFQSAKHAIETEWFESKGASNIVIILHGSGGIEDSGGFFRDLAAALQQHGMTAVVVHYFDRTGIKSASAAQMGAHFSEWLATVQDAEKFVRSQPGCDKCKITLFGHSLGAQLSIEAAARNRDVSSVVDMAGSIVLSERAISHLPPMLILHGSNDTVVPLSRERRLVQVLQRVHCKYEEHIFKGADHSFQTVPSDTLFHLVENFIHQSK